MFCFLKACKWSSHIIDFKSNYLKNVLAFNAHHIQSVWNITCRHWNHIFQYGQCHLDCNVQFYSEQHSLCWKCICNRGWQSQYQSHSWSELSYHLELSVAHLHKYLHEQMVMMAILNTVQCVCMSQSANYSRSLDDVYVRNCIIDYFIKSFVIVFIFFFSLHCRWSFRRPPKSAKHFIVIFSLALHIFIIALILILLCLCLPFMFASCRSLESHIQ